MANPREIETSGTVNLAPTSVRGLNYPIFIGQDGNYLVVHYHDPPRFEIISTSSLKLTRTIDAFDNCRSVQYKNGLIVSASAQMGSHTRTCCMIRFFLFSFIYFFLEFISTEFIGVIYAGCGTWKQVYVCEKFKNPNPHDITILITKLGEINLFGIFLHGCLLIVTVSNRFTTNYLVTVPDLPHGEKRVMKIRDLSVALDSLNQTSTSILLATRDLVS